MQESDEFTSETVRVENSGRIDKVLTEVIPRSRATVQRWLKKGSILIDGEQVNQKDRHVDAGETVTITSPPETEPLSDTLTPAEGPLDVIYEDESIIVVNKPSGLLVHPAREDDTSTLANRLIHHYPDLVGIGPSDRPGLAHRLDKDTSGIILVGRNESALESLKEQFRNRSVQKKYRAILEGELQDKSIRVEVPIARHHSKPMLREANPEGKYAETHLERKGAKQNRSAVICKPVTGRTHQIRVHCQYIGHPIVGDQKYGSGRGNRLMLHAEEVVFTHPSNNTTIDFSVAPPKEVQSQWNQIQQK